MTSSRWIAGTSGLARLAAIVSVAALAGGACAAVPSQSPTSSQRAGAPGGIGTSYAEIVELARAEGEINLWTDKLGTAEDLAALETAFNARTGADIHINYVPISSQDGTTRLIAEKQAGQSPSADWISGGSDTMLLLDDAGLVASLDWEGTFGREFPGIADRADRTALRGRALELMHQIYAIAYNTEQITRDELPKTFEELVEPKYAGKITVDPRGYPFNYLVPFWGYDRVAELVAGIGKNDPSYVSGASAIATAIGSGEAVFGVTTTNRAEFIKAQGQPIDWFTPSEVPIQIESLVVLKDAKHPNAAFLFSAWLTSEEGRAMIEETVKVGLAWTDSGSKVSGRMEEFGTTEFSAADTEEELQQQFESLKRLEEVYLAQ